jgi:peptide deformylase
MGFGRAISAPQIGVALRFIALNLGDERGAFTLINPVIVDRSAEVRSALRIVPNATYFFI